MEFIIKIFLCIIRFSWPSIPEKQAKVYDNYIKEGNIPLLIEIDEAQRNESERTFADNRSINTEAYAIS